MTVAPLCWGAAVGRKEKVMKEEKMTTIMLPRGRKNEENFVIVTVNGRSWKIMKGVEVEVPVYVAEVLENGRMMADEARRYVEKMAE